ncbi:MAG: spore germination protein [Bacilli bacterium]|nr:spore germination protein [Bacilli bacterium]
MNKIVTRIQKEFSKTPDLVIKEIQAGLFKTIYVVFLETVSSGDKVNDYILKNLANISSNGSIKTNLESIIPGPNMKEITELDQIEFYITSGFAIVILKDTCLAVEVRADIHRSVGSPESEPAIVGPKDAFTENFQINLGLVKRRIKTSKLKTDNFVVGRKTNTTVGVLYLDDVANKEFVKKIEKRISEIDIDGIIDSSTLGLLIEGNDKTSFPKVLRTERPDNASNALLEGKIVILVDTSPFALILPAFFADFINPVVDNYVKSGNAKFVKILRLACYFLSMITPAYYIAIVNYNQETIPTSLLINFATQREGVPFPSIIEALIMLIICEILRESDLRFPNAYGSAISILGALVLGEAAVSAGIVSPIMIIIIAITFITGLVFTDYETVASIRFYRFFFLVAASFYGLFGVVCAFVYFLIKMNSSYSFDKPYFFPLSPFDKTYFKKTIYKGKTKKDNKRTSMLTNNITKKKNGDII